MFSVFKGFKQLCRWSRRDRHSCFGPLNTRNMRKCRCFNFFSKTRQGKFGTDGVSLFFLTKRRGTFGTADVSLFRPKTKTPKHWQSLMFPVFKGLINYGRWSRRDRHPCWIPLNTRSMGNYRCSNDFHEKKTRNMRNCRCFNVSDRQKGWEHVELLRFRCFGRRQNAETSTIPHAPCVSRGLNNYDDQVAETTIVVSPP